MDQMLSLEQISYTLHRDGLHLTRQTNATNPLNFQEIKKYIFLISWSVFVWLCMVWMDTRVVLNCIIYCICDLCEFKNICGCNPSVRACYSFGYIRNDLVVARGLNAFQSSVILLCIRWLIRLGWINSTSTWKTNAPFFVVTYNVTNY